MGLSSKPTQIIDPRALSSTLRGGSRVSKSSKPPLQLALLGLEIKNAKSFALFYFETLSLPVPTEHDETIL